MPQCNSNSLDPDVNDAPCAALNSIRNPRSLTTAAGRNGLHGRLQKLTDEWKDLLDDKL
jgi:hypothetical protein